MSGSTADDKPPFSTWRTLYAAVALSLGVEILGLAVLRWIYR